MAAIYVAARLAHHVIYIAGIGGRKRNSRHSQ
jgi:hypothetical protein